MADAREPAATLTLTRGPEAGLRFDLGAAPVTIGRQDQCEVQVPGTWVSRRHARLAWTGTGYIVEDLGSTNGTFVNGERVSGPRALRSGDRGLLLLSLLNDHRTRNLEQAEALLDEWLGDERNGRIARILGPGR